MNAVDVAYSKNREFHTAEFKSLGPVTEVLWKGGTKSQRDRFTQIVRLLPDLSGKRVLDVGCGFGDFWSYLQELGCRDVEYCGIDLCPEMVAECRQRFAGVAFHESGMLEFEPEIPEYDVTIASGLFAMPNPDWDSYVVQTVASMFRASRIAVAVNFLSNYSRSPSPESHYANPGHTLELLMKNVTPWATLAHDYRWNDFTIALFREPQPR